MQTGIHMMNIHMYVSPWRENIYVFNFHHQYAKNIEF